MAEHRCPCCEQTTFSEKGSFEICAVCNWEDDPVQLEDPSFAGGANDPSLDQAREYWRLAGTPLPPNRTEEMERVLALVGNGRG